MASKVITTTNRVLNEPLLTGGLLYLLTRAPPHVRDRILQPFRSNILAHNGSSRLASLIKVLKALTAIGVLKRISQLLTRLALNNWRFGRIGAPFKFGPQKEELIVITGGSSGFGYDMVKGFAGVARVVAIDIADFPEELERLDGVFFYPCDITDFTALEAVCEQIRSEHGDPTVLINNAGIANGKPILKTTNERTERLFKVNLISHFALIREFVPGMLKMQKGHVVTVASMASFVAAGGLVDYCCSKTAALYLNDGLRAELVSRYPNGKSICTTSVHPSWHRTGMTKDFEERMKKRGFYVDPSINVSNRIIEQVLKGRSGRIYVPGDQEFWAQSRNWPLWFQDIIAGNVGGRGGLVSPPKAESA